MKLLDTQKLKKSIAEANIIVNVILIKNQIENFTQLEQQI